MITVLCYVYLFPNSISVFSRYSHNCLFRHPAQQMAAQSENIQGSLKQEKDVLSEVVNLLMPQILVLGHLLIMQVVYFGMPGQENFRNRWSVERAVCPQQWPWPLQDKQSVEPFLQVTHSYPQSQIPKHALSVFLLSLTCWSIIWTARKIVCRIQKYEPGWESDLMFFKYLRLLRILFCQPNPF